MRRFPCWVGLGACALAVSAGDVELASPDGRVRYRITGGEGGALGYAVAADGKERLGLGRLGPIVEGKDLGAACGLGPASHRELAEVFPWRGSKTQATNHCRVTEIPVTSGGSVSWTLEVRVFNDGVGFRYRVPGAGARRVSGEATTWQLPADATVWFQTDTDDYEGAYRSAGVGAIPLEEEAGGTRRPVHLGPPVTLEYAGGGNGLLTEAGLYRYSGLTFRPRGSGSLAAAFEDDPAGWMHEGEVVSPWRVAILADDLNGLINSDVIAALCDPPDPALFPQGPNTAWLRPGRAPCTWMVFGNDGAQWDRQKWFVDVSAAMGCEYLLVDAGWRTERWGWLKDGADLWQRVAELVRYAGERRVGIVLWHAYPEGRDDGPGLTKIEAREELFRRCQEAGVKGIKIDFFNSESRAVIDAYEDLLRRSARHGLLINFHGANKPTGESRTWPHEITREGIREQEYVLWDSLPLSHYGALPFTRMAVGHADFLPGYVQPRFLKNTTLGFQMASVVVFSSPFLCWPDNPDAYLQSPVLGFVRSVPVTWDETRVLGGTRVGETVLLARRKADAWYIAGLNCRPEARELDVDLSGFELERKALTLYRDGQAPAGIVIEAGVPPPASRRVRLATLAGGGFVVQLAPPRKFAGWE